MAPKRGYTLNLNTPRLVKAAAFRSELAEHVAEGGELLAFAQARGITQRNAQRMWLIIRTEMGAQAA